MSPYNYRWVVKVNRGYFMAGIHRFRLRKDAEEFCRAWLATPGNVPKVYADIPSPKKEIKRAKETDFPGGDS